MTDREVRGKRTGRKRPESLGSSLALSLLLIVCLPAPALAQTFEITGGETVFSQNSQYYFGEVGDFYPLGGASATQNGGTPSPDVGTAATGALSLHLFVAVFYFSYETPGPPMTTQNAYNGLNPAAGLRVPFRNGFWEGDVGIALAEAFQTDTPIESLAGIYLQTEYYQGLGPGAFDFFANYIGYIQYIYGQARYLSPVWESPQKEVAFFLGPELIGQGNNTYNAGQGGAVLGVSLPRLHSYLTFDGGLLRSSVSDGWGGYQGFSWYVSF